MYPDILLKTRNTMNKLKELKQTNTILAIYINILLKTRNIKKSKLKQTNKILHKTWKQTR